MSALANPPSEVTPSYGWPTYPYKGLNYYAPNDAPLFGQRDEELVECGTLISHNATKMLLLHGRTGTGKSSFLRAGLFPRYLDGNPSYFCLRDEQTLEPHQIRSTADPISAIADAIRSRLTKNNQFRILPPEDLAKSLSLLDWSETTEYQERSSKLLSALKTVTSQLPGTLILAIDQAEEVFTLESNALESSKAAYFDFLETLCYEHFDIKLLIVLRTEYYGQFVDRFRLGPELTVSTVRSGIAQFMLQGIRQLSKLVEVIEMPTKRDSKCDLGAPGDVYKFSFQPGLPNRIATDVLHHCGESSTLPVLQLVCLDLYTKINGQAIVITHDLYETSGKVAGTLERFIEHSIARSLEAGNKNKPKSAEIEKWIDVLSLLVARQEGGALTSLLIAAKEMREEASNRGLLSPEVCLEAMATDDIRLLRSVQLAANATDQGIHYSLGHDCLAPSLFQRREGQQLLEAERKQTAGRNRKYKVAILVLLAGAVFWMYRLYLTEASSISYAEKYVNVEPQTRLKILSLIASIQNVSPFMKLLNGDDSYKEILSSTLLKAPVLSYEASLAGVDGKGENIASLSESGDVFVNNVTVPIKASNTQKTPIRLAPEQPSFRNSIGFVSDLAGPVLYRNGVVTYLISPTKAVDQPVEDLVSKIMPGPSPWPEVSGGSIRLNSRQGPNRSLNVVNFIFDPITSQFALANPDATSITPAGLLGPVFSDGFGLFADISSRPGESVRLIVTPLIGDRDNVLEVDLNAVAPQDGILNPFIRSIAFVTGERAVLVRESSRRFIAVQLGSNKQELTIPDDVPNRYLGVVRSQFLYQRPLLTAARTERGFRLAWLTESGISVFDTDGDKLKPIQQPLPLLPSITSPELASKLIFSKDGNTLTLLQQRPGGLSQIRVWDLSIERSSRLKGEDLDGLVAEACQTLRNDPTGLSHKEQLTDDESKRPEFAKGQLCK